MPQLADRFREDAAKIEGDVAVADDDRDLVGKVESAVAKIRMAVVPADEFGRGMTARQVLARNAEPPVRAGTAREHHGMIATSQFVDRHVAPDLDVRDEPEALVLRDARVSEDDFLQLRVVRSDTEAHEPVGYRHPLDDIDVRDHARRDE